MLTWKERAAAIREVFEAMYALQVAHPEALEVTARLTETTLLLEVRTHPSDLGGVIGKGGQWAEMARHLGQRMVRKGHYFALDLLEPRGQGQ